MKPKLRLLLLPYIIISVSFLLVYCFVYWIFVIKFHVIEPNEQMVNLWLPFSLPWVPILIWLRPRIKRLKLNRTGNRSPDFAYMLFAAFGMAAPVMVAMNYLESATGKITMIKNVDELSSQPATMFYSINKYFADKSKKAIEFTSHVTGRYNSDLDLDIYIACPLYDSDEATLITPAPGKTAPDTAVQNPPEINIERVPLIILDGKEITQQQLYKISPQSIKSMNILKGNSAIALYGEKGKNGVMILESIKNEKPPVAWLGIHYGKEISNYSNRDKKTEEENIFYDESLEDFKFLELSGYSYFERTGNNDARLYYRKAVSKSMFGNNSENAIILEPKTGDFNKRTGNEFPWIFGAYLIGLCVWFIMILIPKIDTETETTASIEEDKNQMKSYFKFFVPRQDYYITPILIDINIFMFILMAFSGLGFMDFGVVDLLKWGANFFPYTSDGQWWRLLSSMFLHAGIIHLLSNMFALFFIGLILEPIIGKKTFAISYFLCGITASIFSIWWHDNTVSVGASGAIFGLFGIFLALLIMKSVSKEMNKSFLLSTIIFIAYNLIMGSFNSVIDNACHIGGLICGLLIGFYLATSDKFKDNSNQTIA